MSDQKQKVVPAEQKPADKKNSEELADEALDAVSGGMANLGAAIPGVTGASSLSSRETGSCISQ
jgi:hypothetical protein